MARTGRAEARGLPVVYPRLSGTMSDIAGACLRRIDGAPSSEELWAEIYSASQSKGGRGDDVRARLVSSYSRGRRTERKVWNATMHLTPGPGEGKQRVPLVIELHVTFLRA